MSGGKSSQSQTENFTDNRAVLGEGALYANNGASITNNSTSYVLDGGAIGHAFDLSADALGFGASALDFGKGVFSGALDFGSDALAGSLDASGRTVTQALNFGSDALGGALDANASALTKAFNFGGDALSLTERVLDYSADSTAAALDNLQATQALTANAYNDAKGRGAMTDKILIGAIGAVALVAYFALTKGRA